MGGRHGSGSRKKEASKAKNEELFDQDSVTLRGASRAFWRSGGPCVTLSGGGAHELPSGRPGTRRHLEGWQLGE